MTTFNLDDKRDREEETWPACRLSKEPACRRSKEKAARRRLLNSNLMIVDQAAQCWL
jgi:hypothetical protein